MIVFPDLPPKAPTAEKEVESLRTYIAILVEELERQLNNYIDDRR